MVLGGSSKRKTQARLRAVLCVFCLCLYVGGVGTASAQTGGTRAARTQGTLAGSVSAPSLRITVKQALEAVRLQTGYTPVVNFDNIAPARMVTLTATVLATDEFLRQVLAGTGFTYEPVGRRILVVPAPPKIDDGAGAIAAMWNPDDEETADMTMITFRIGSSVPERGFMDNAHALADIDRRLADTAVLARLDHISVTAASSPGGNTETNERLAVSRALTTKSYLERRYPDIEPSRIHPFSVGEEWTGLRRLVDEDPRVPSHDEVLRVLDNTPDETMRDSLQTIAGGRAWRYISAGLLPKLRAATAITLHLYDASTRGRIDTVGVADSAAAMAEMAAGAGVRRVEIVRPVKPVEVEVEVPVVVEIARPVLALRTNALLFAAGVPNLGVEIPIGTRWSLAAEGVIFPWRGVAGGATVEGRRWLGRRGESGTPETEGMARPLLTGWFAGVYAGGGSYAMGSNHRGPFFHTGLSGGYAHTITPTGNLRMEYTLGIGYLRAGSRNWFGPTKAGVSIVFMLNETRRETRYEKRLVTN